MPDTVAHGGKGSKLDELFGVVAQIELFLVGNRAYPPLLRGQGAERILLVCGMHHAEDVARQLEREQAVPLTRPVRKNVRLVHLHPLSLAEVLSEIPFYVAAYEARRQGLPAEPERRTPAPAGRSYGPFRVLSGGRGDDPRRLEDAVARAAREGAVRDPAWPAAPRARRRPARRPSRLPT